MRLLVHLSRSLLALMVCVVAGWVVGYFWPALGHAAYVVAKVYLGVVSMAAIPLLVVATFFGLRQIMQLPHPGKRMVWIAGGAFALVLACSVVGVLGGMLLSPGASLDAESRLHLGTLVQQQGGDTEMQLWTPEQIMLPEPSVWATIVPDNVFRVLAEGRTLGILLAALFFGVGFAALPKEQTQALNRLFEASYRALELIIHYANAMLPIVAFGMSAHLLASADMASIASMGGFVLDFFCLVAGLSVACVVLIAQRSGLPVWRAVQHLKEPLMVSLVSSSSTASIPHSIEALSTKLGFSRGVVELVVPISAVFVRAGSALYYVLLTVFVAHLYGRPLDASEWALVCLSATAAAFASAGTNGLVNLGFAALTLSVLQLPTEAALVLFVAIDFLCEGLRNVLSLLMTCALVALFAAGLPSEKPAAVFDEPSESCPLQLVLTKGSVAVLIVGSGLLAAFIVMAGIGMGVRSAEQPATGLPHPVRMVSGGT